MDKVSMSHLISFSRYQISQVLIYTVDDIINFKIFLWSNSKAMADWEKKREDKNTKIWISQEGKELFRWNKKHISYFWRAII